jgi:hypothetical protein
MLGLNHANRDGYRGAYHRARIRATRWLRPSYALLEILYKSHAPVYRAIGRSTLLMSVETRLAVKPS